jgi:hypothetical protein
MTALLDVLLALAVGVALGMVLPTHWPTDPKENWP